MSLKDITIVITSFKSEKKIKNCLNSINRQCKIINVENSDDQNYQKKIEEEFSNVKCILSGENMGYGKGNNIGLKEVKSKYALILNPDAELFPDSIDSFLKMAKENSDFAMITPFTLEDKNDLKSFNLSEKSPSFDHGISLNIKTIKTVRGHAMFLNLDQFKDIGFFDENIFFFLEETDLAMRLFKNNKKIYFCAPIKIYHEGGKSHENIINHEMELSRNWHWMWSTFYYNKKYSGYLISLIKIFPKLIKSFFKTIFYFLILNKKKGSIYLHRMLGILNSLLGQKSWYRPKV
jgi:N-acetylglucosaminyl-diphospho-decaprenol L-rhamnosyltransferase